MKIDSKCPESVIQIVTLIIYDESDSLNLDNYGQ